MNHTDGQRIAIVGGGPMCLYALERLAALLTADTSRWPAPWISVFERSGNFGAGEVNSDKQPSTSLMNRVSAQIGFAADESNLSIRPLLRRQLRPTLHEWLQARHRESGDDLYALRPGDIPPRWLHGVALKDMFQTYVGLLQSAGARVDLHATEVVDVCLRRDGGSPFAIHSVGADVVETLADRILFVTGNALSFALPTSAAPRFSSGPKTIARAYPLDRQLTLETVPPGCVVGVDGLGLTAIDVFLHLTKGRGGRFEPVVSAGDALVPRFRYVPSGREPSAIVAFSPSGMLPYCRPENVKLTNPALTYRGRFFTSAAVRRLRLSRGRPTQMPNGRTMNQLDFDASVLPVVILEMGALYYSTLFGAAFGELVAQTAQARYQIFLDGQGPSGEAAVEFLLEPVQACFADAVRHLKDQAADDLATMDIAGAFRAVLYATHSAWPASARSRDADKTITSAAPSPWGHSLDVRDHRFAWKHLLHPLALDGYTSPELWVERLKRFMTQDLLNGQQDNIRNPVKAACDGVLRDLRSVFCEVVDHGGLMPRSHQSFLGGFMRCYTRLSNGAGIEPTAKVLALIEHELLDVSIGPGPVVERQSDGFAIRGQRTGATRHVSLIVDAKLPPFDATNMANPLYPNLLRRGLVRKWVNPDAEGGSDFCPGGLDLSDGYHPLNSAGVEDTRLTFLGTPAEGMRFFHSAAARPNCNSGVFNTLSQWAAESLGTPQTVPVTT
jgi:hypothetical protein